MANQNLIDYLNSEKQNNLDKITSLDIIISSINDSITNFNNQIDALNNEITSGNDEINTLTNNNLLIDEIITILNEC